MIYAYSEFYLNDAKKILGTTFDYLVNDCNYDADWVSQLFDVSGYADMFEKGNPAIITGMSGIELGHAIIEKTYQSRDFPEYHYKQGYTPEYWSGWALAEYQWYTCRRFCNIFARIPLSEIILMYPVYHEMDISNFIIDMEEKFKLRFVESNLRKFRKNSKLSQEELAKVAEVSIEDIAAYENGSKSIDDAPAKELYKIAFILGCSIESLLENPLDI